ncbi:MAG TPA: replication-relaxation family protein [Solirubrobacteraceae bacterium]
MFVSEVRLATGHQIARRLWASASPTDVRARAARRALARLEGQRVVDRLGRRVGGVRGGSTSIVYRMGPVGRRLLARRGLETRRLSDPGERYVAHTLVITELLVRMHEATSTGGLEVIEYQTEPRCWRGFIGAMGARLILKPDLFLRTGAGALEDRWFLEVDCATESAATIARKAKLYVIHYRSGDEQQRAGVYPHVVWTAPHEGRAKQVRAALRRLPPAAQRLFMVWLYDESVGRLAAEAQR